MRATFIMLYRGTWIYMAFVIGYALSTIYLFCQMYFLDVDDGNDDDDGNLEDDDENEDAGSEKKLVS